MPYARIVMFMYICFRNFLIMINIILFNSSSLQFFCFILCSENIQVLIKI
uniref:Uncharacterized protein n=1 Tax=Acartia pacifica TaxID=335913 RepID=A0A0U2KDB1_ACAPC|nr:hypothetical protein [Acartia pacifica]